MTNQQTHFERVGPRYLRARASANHLHLKRRMWEDFLGNKAFLRKPGLRVLEPMCGYAEGKSILETHLGIPVAYEGFDLNEAFVRMAQERNLGSAIYEMDVLQFDKVEEFDLALIIGGLHHLAGRARDALAAVARSLRPGGYLINYEPTHNMRLIGWIRDRIYKRNDLFDHQSEKGFRLDELNELYKESGFRLVDQCYPGLLSYVLYYNPDAFPLLNIGGVFLVDVLYRLDRPFMRNAIGRKVAFATLSLLQKDR